MNQALSNIFKASTPASKEERPRSPFPNIPDLSSNPEIVEGFVNEGMVIRSVTPSFLEAKPDPKKEAEVLLARKRAERAASPFPIIPDVQLEENLVESDVHKFRHKEHLQSSLRPSSPFPAIADVKLNPEIVEQDVVTLRTSPVPFRVPSVVSFEKENVTEEETKEKEQSVEPPETVPFPTIPDISKYLAKSDSNLFKPIATKPFESVSLDTGKKYEMKGPADNYVPPPMKPEFNFALADTEFKVVEHSFSNATASNIRTLQSEIFESQGHFNASRSCSPRVFIPKCEIEQPKNEPEKKELKKIVKVETQEPKDPKYEEQMKQLTLSGEKSEILMSQKSCFNEMHTKKQQEIACTLEDNEINHILRGMKMAREGIVPHTDENIQVQSVVKQEITKSREESKEEAQTLYIAHDLSQIVTPPVEFQSNQIASVEQSESFQNEKTYTMTTSLKEERYLPSEAIETRNLSEETIQKEETVMETEELTELENIPITPKVMEGTPPKNNNVLEHKIEEERKDEVISISKNKGIIFDIEPKICKKAPETIIGARPLFGQLDINSEFKKALVGRQKSIQGKRSREVNKIDQNPEPRVKIEKTETRNHEENTSKSKLSAQYKSNEAAQIETIRPSDNEEIEKVYYTQEREYHVDYQKVEEEFVMPDGRTMHYSYTPSVTYSPVPPAIHNQILMQQQQQSTSQQNVVVENMQMEYYDENGEKYKKLPVKSLIKNFEQCSMPAMRYKKIRDPLPDVVEKINPKLSENVNFSIQQYQQQSIQSSQIQYREPINNQELMLRQAEQDFDNLYYVANSRVETNYMNETSSFNNYNPQPLIQTYPSAFQPVRRNGSQPQIEGKLLLLLIFYCAVCCVQ